MADITLGSISGNITPEGNGTATFTVKLANTQPTNDVRLNITSADVNKATVDQNVLIFTNANWNTNQTISVRGVGNNLATGNQDVIITVAVDAVYSDDTYDSVSNKTITVTIVDDDDQGITIVGTPTVTEAGATDTFTVKLNGQPSSDVTLSVVSGDTGEVTVGTGEVTGGIPTLTFTPANWNIARIVTVTGVNDNLIDGSVSTNVTIAYSSGDTNFNAVSSNVVVTTTDNDVAGFTLSKTTATVTEASTTDTFTVVLDAKPNSNVVLSVVSSDTGEVTVSSSTLTFTPSIWAIPQTITVTGINDNLDDGNINVSVTIAVVDASSDNAFDSVVDQTVTVTNTDNDAAGFTLNKTAAIVSETTTNTFTVVLDTQPSDTVVLDVVSTDSGEVTVSSGSSSGSSSTQITFLNSNWSTAQTVTIRGVSDSTSDGPQSVDINISVNRTGTAASEYDSYTTVKKVVALVTDVDGADITISSNTATVTEIGGTDTITVQLNKMPATDVVLNVSSADTGEVTALPATLTFTQANWNTAQTVTFTGVNDELIDGGQTTSVTISTNNASSDNAFDSKSKTVNVTTSDDDVAGFSLSGSTLSINEGGTNNFTVVLSKQPNSNVVFGIVSSDTAIATVSGPLTFTPLTWATPQNVTVTGVNNSTISNSTATITVSVTDSSSDNNFDPLNNKTVAVTVVNNDVAGFTLNKTAATVTEASTTDTVTVVLDAKPESDVVLSVVSSDTGEVTVSSSTLTFTPSTWATPQQITVTGVNDNLDDGNINVSVIFAYSSGDTNFNAIANQTVTVTNTDNDAAGFTVVLNGNASLLTLTVSEVENNVSYLNTNTFTVKLTSQPINPVVLSVTSADTSEVSVSHEFLTFTNDNWNTNQTVTVTGLRDSLVDGNIQTYVVVSVIDAESDNTYHNVPNHNITVWIMDANAAGFTISRTTASVNESGTTDTYTVVLNNGPLTDVVISNTSAFPGKVTTSGNLTFTSSNWNIPQTVTVTGARDNTLTLNNQTVDITIAVVDDSSDNAFDSVVNQTVTVTLVENDSAIVLSAETLSVNENATGTFTVKLGAQPVSNVILNIISDTISIATVSSSTLTFTPSTWATPQDIIVTGVNNDTLGNGSATIRISVDPSSSNEFDAGPAKTVAVTVVNNDIAGFTLNQNTATIWENGGTGTFTVVLDAKPNSNVVIDVVSSDTGIVSVSSSTLTFTPLTWATPQDITVTGVDDLIVDGSIVTNVTVSVNRASSDDNFDNVLSQIVAVTTLDNEYGFVVSSNRINLFQYRNSSSIFKVTLTRRPSSNVVISVNSANSNKVAVSPSSVTFTDANWNTPQIVTATVPIELESPRIANEIVRITLSVVDGSSDNNFDSFNDVIVNTIINYNRQFSFNLMPSMTNSFGLRLLYNNNTYSLSNQPKGIGIANTASGKRASKRR